MHIELTKRKRNLILFSACIATFMATLDGSIVNIALPILKEHFSVSISAVSWAVTVYLLTISAILLIWGKLADLYGNKTLFALGIGIFTIGSFLCGIAISFPMLIIARIVQAIGASITMALVQGIVTSIFPSNERGKALGVLATTVAIGSLAGPSLGGILIEIFNWRAIFFINLPFGIFGVILTIFIMPNIKPAEINKTFDIKGSAFFVFSILLLFISLIFIQDGFISLQIFALIFVIALLLFSIFIKIEKKHKYPLINLNIFKNKTLSIGLFCAYIFFLAMFSYLIFVPFYLNLVLKLSIFETGLLMSLYPLSSAILSPFCGRLSDKITFKPLTIIGMSINTFALTLMLFFNQNTNKYLIGLVILLLGMGGAFFGAPNTSSIMGSVSRDKLGVTGSLTAFFRNFGMVSGTTISVIIFSAVTNIGFNTISSGAFDSSVFMQGFKAVILTSALLCFVAVLINAFRKN